MGDWDKKSKFFLAILTRIPQPLPDTSSKLSYHQSACSPGVGNQCPIDQHILEYLMGQRVSQMQISRVWHPLASFGFNSAIYSYPVPMFLLEQPNRASHFGLSKACLTFQAEHRYIQANWFPGKQTLRWRREGRKVSGVHSWKQHPYTCKGAKGAR